MSEGRRVDPKTPIRHEVTALPTGSRAHMPDMSGVVDQIRRAHGTSLAATEVTVSETQGATPEDESTGKRPNVKGKTKKRVAVFVGIAGAIALVNVFFGGNEEPTKSTATDPFGTATPKRPGTATVPAATGASTPSQPSQRSSTGLACNMTSVAPSIDQTGNIATTAKGKAKGFEATLSVENAKNAKEVAIRAGVVVNNAIDRANVVSITPNENGTYHINEPIPDTVYAIYAQEGSQSEVCGAFKFSDITPQAVSDATVPQMWSN